MVLIARYVRSRGANPVPNVVLAFFFGILAWCCVCCCARQGTSGSLVMVQSAGQAYGQPYSYGQPAPYGQAAPYGQPPPYGHPQAYDHAKPYEQPPAYGQAPNAYAQQQQAPNPYTQVSTASFKSVRTTRRLWPNAVRCPLQRRSF
jgi:hypothetical protein